MLYDLSCSNCKAIAAHPHFCKLSCNECPKTVDYFCSFATKADNKDNCNAYGETVCQKTTSEGRFPCSECEAIGVFCDYASPKYLKKCQGQAEKHCDTLCHYDYYYD